MFVSFAESDAWKFSLIHVLNSNQFTGVLNFYLLLIITFRPCVVNPYYFFLSSEPSPIYCYFFSESNILLLKSVYLYIFLVITIQPWGTNNLYLYLILEPVWRSLLGIYWIHSPFSFQLSVIFTFSEKFSQTVYSVCFLYLHLVFLTVIWILLFC